MSDGQSTTSPLFESSAEEVAKRLEGYKGEVASSMAQEARILVNEFRSWRSNRPLNEVRISKIRQLFDLHRRAMEYFAQQPLTTSSDGPLSGGYKR